MHPVTTRLAPRPLPGLLRRLALALVLALLVPNIFTALDLFASWRSIERVEFDPAAARESLQTVPATTPPPVTTTTVPGSESTSTTGPPATSTTTTTTTLPVLPEGLQTFLIVGEDTKPDPTANEIVRADGLMVAALDQAGDRIAVISVPRDTVVPDPCGGPDRRIQELFEGCHGVSGPDLLAIAVEDLFDLSIDHYVVIGFESFAGAIDLLDGMKICLKYAFSPAIGDPLQMAAGCHVYNGSTVLRWLRSRTGVQLIGGEWAAMEGGDFSRMNRQRVVLVGLFTALKRVRNPGELADLAAELTDGLVLDSGFDLGEAVSLAWEARSIPSASIASATLPVRQQVTEAGVLVAYPTEDPATYARLILAG